MYPLTDEGRDTARAMSQENVQLVRDLYELMPNLREADPEAWDRALRDYADPRFELQLPADYPEGRQVFEGREGIDAMVATLRSAWREFRFVPERFLDAKDRVVVFARLVAVGHESGVPIELETTHVWTVRDRRVTSMHAYRNRSEALEAVGLGE